MEIKTNDKPIYYKRRRTEDERRRLYITARDKLLTDPRFNSEKAMQYARNF